LVVIISNSNLYLYLFKPCTDVFWFPVATEEFCEDLITTMETFGEWSHGNNNNYDERLPGGYENVPTVDIHMTQVGFQNHWLYFLRKIVQPIQKRLFVGYVHDVSHSTYRGYLQ
jgi:procollagen-lysine,2-oxoglutarate 5-dioxygenase